MHRFLRKTYRLGRRRTWGYVFRVAIFGVFFITFVEGACRPVQSAANIPPRCEPLIRGAIINLTNVARGRGALRALRENPVLNSIADARVRGMLDNQYFGHVSPIGDGLIRVAEKAGYKYRFIAENLASGAFCTNQGVVDMWLQSPNHRKSLLSSQVSEIGVSVARGRMNGTETWIIVQVFGLPLPRASSAASCTLEQAELEDLQTRTFESKTINGSTGTGRQEGKEAGPDPRGPYAGP
jgi:hypothetical protein